MDYVKSRQELQKIAKLIRVVCELESDLEIEQYEDWLELVRTGEPEHIFEGRGYVYKEDLLITPRCLLRACVQGDHTTEFGQSICQLYTV